VKETLALCKDDVMPLVERIWNLNSGEPASESKLRAPHTPLPSLSDRVGTLEQDWYGKRTPGLGLQARLINLERDVNVQGPVGTPKDRLTKLESVVYGS